LESEHQLQAESPVQSSEPEQPQAFVEATAVEPMVVENSSLEWGGNVVELEASVQFLEPQTTILARVKRQHGDSDCDSDDDDYAIFNRPWKRARTQSEPQATMLARVECGDYVIFNRPLKRARTFQSGPHATMLARVERGDSGCDSGDDYAIFNRPWKRARTLESEHQLQAESPVQSSEPEQPQASVDALSESVAIDLHVEPWDAIVEEGDEDEEVEEEEDLTIVSVFEESDLHELEEEEGTAENPVVLRRSSRIASLPVVNYKESSFRPRKRRKKKCTLRRSCRLAMLVPVRYAA
jgi:hypothetical protein